MSDDPIAITGIGCRFPGGINSPQTFWDFILRGGDAVQPISKERKTLWSNRGQEHEFSGPGGEIDHIDRFDAAFFQISPREAKHIDPQQRVLLELAWEALEDGGIPPRLLAGTPVGVFIGIFLDEYWDLQRYTDARQIDGHTNTGGTMSIAANRISYVFDFKGPSLSVDTACSSSLTAIHLACQSLYRKECDLALAGGVNLILSPQTTQGFNQAHMLSPDGRCRAFDAEANGYGRSDGAGLVVLKPLHQAEKDGDNIYAVIHGSAINQDGRTQSLTQPDPLAQEGVIHTASQRANITADQLTYIEAHGTGTPTGDPLEALAIGQATGRSSTCLIGSVKTNIGHTEAAAGVAGLIKTALILKHHVIPPSLHFNQPNPAIPFEKLNLRVVTESKSIDGQVYAGVNSFGFGGANAHAILGSPPEKPTRVASEKAPYLLVFSGEKYEALHMQIQRVKQQVLIEPPVDLYPLAATLGERRDHHPHRATVVSSTIGNTVEILDALNNGTYSEHGVIGRTSVSPTPIVFIMTGMGPQWWGMGQTLFHSEPVFRTALEACDKIFQELSGKSILEDMLKGEAESQMTDPEVSQPANLFLQWALYKLWTSWGVEPDMVVGHSVGEVTAACISGAISLGEAIRIIYHRSRLQQDAQGTGAMLAVGLAPDETEKLIAPYENKISIAAINSPIAVTVSGEKDAINRLEDQLLDLDIYCKRLQVKVAYHSQMMDPYHDAFIEAIGDLKTKSPRIPMISTVTGRPVDGQELKPAYWWENIRSPVLFEAACAHLPDTPNQFLIQLGPHPVLSFALSENLAHYDRAGIALSSLQRGHDEREMMLKTLAQCYVHGQRISWEQVFNKPYTPVQLPSYPWQKERFWLTPSNRPAEVSSRRKKLFLNESVTSSVHSDIRFWEASLDWQQHHYLSDHTIEHKPLLPMACLIEMLMETQTDPGQSVTFQAFKIHQPLIISEKQSYTLQLCRNNHNITISSSQSKSLDGAYPWQTLATALWQPDDEESGPLKIDPLSQYDEVSEGVAYYNKIVHQGYTYGPQFQNITQISYSKQETLAHIQFSQEDVPTQWVHPCLLDAMIQSFIPLFPESTLCLPLSVDRIVYHRPLSSENSFRAVARMVDTKYASYVGDAVLFNSQGQRLLELRGLRFDVKERTQKTNPKGEDRPWLYRERWLPVENLLAETTPRKKRWIIFNSAQGIESQLNKKLAETQIIYDLIAEDQGKLLRSSKDFEYLIHTYADDRDDHAVDILFFSSRQDSEETVPAIGDQAITGLHLIQGVINSHLNKGRLWLITLGGQSIEVEDEPDLGQASIWGVGRVLFREHPELGCTIIDLPSEPGESDYNILMDIIKSAPGEHEYGVRKQQIYRRRLLPVEWSQFEGRKISNSGFIDASYQLSSDPPGSIEHLNFHRVAPVESLAPDEVRLRVLVTGLNFRDVMTAMGLLPGFTDAPLPLLGWECVGEIIAIGTHTERVQVGDMVIAIAPGCFGRYIDTNESLVVAKPDNITMEEAATLPIAFITAYYSLVTLGRIDHHNRVLIHAATGGVGLAAIQWAKIWKAEIFATAGSPEKRRYLEEMGIPHVMESRNTKFADEIMVRTQNKGVDVILNSLGGEGMQKSLSVLAPYGRFIEIGKTDLLRHQSVDLHHFEQNISYHTVDLARLSMDQPDLVGSMLEHVISQTAAGKIKPLPLTAFPIQEVQSAYRTMSQAHHIGKLLVTGNDDPVMMQLKVDDPVIKPDATYLITGGMGAIGQIITEWLIDQGARHIILLGRRDITQEKVKSLLADRMSDVEIIYQSVDVSDREALQNALMMVQTDRPPLRGLFHCAGVRDDGLISNYDANRLEKVLSGKAVGAWNLHTLTLGLDLDLFILFSSVASIVGTAGQGGYAAANACLDALAAMRRSKGLPGLCINWGPWANAGMADDDHASDRLKRQGFHMIRPKEACDLLDQMLHYSIDQICVMPLDGEEPRIIKDNPLFNNTSDQLESFMGLTAVAYTVSYLKGLVPEQKKALVCRSIREAVSQIMELDGATITMKESWRSLGVDSLMSVELRQHIESRLHVSIPVTDFQSSKSISLTVAWIIDQWDQSII